MVQRLSVIRRRKLLKLLLAVVLTVLAILLVVHLVKGRSTEVIRASTNEERVTYLSSLGYDADPLPLTEQVITLPETFPDVLKDYNDLQKKQGFDLEKYAGKEITMYTYRIKNYEAAGEVQSSLYVYKNRLVGGDIHSTAYDGFMKELR